MIRLTFVGGVLAAVLTLQLGLMLAGRQILEQGKHQADQAALQVVHGLEQWRRANSQPGSWQKVPLKRLLGMEPNLAYLILEVVEPRRGSALRLGEVNPNHWRQLPARFAEKPMPGWAVLIGEGQGGAGPGFEVLTVTLRDLKQLATVNKVRFKIGYVVAYYETLRRITWVSEAVVGFLLMTLVGLWGMQRGRHDHNDGVVMIGKRLPDKAPTSMEEVDLLTSVLDEDATEIVSLVQPSHLKNEQWISLWDDQGLQAWERRGNWYVTGDFIIATPWCASLVRTDFRYSNYIYRVKAKKISGVDGFIVLFICEQKLLVWVLGGWNNSRSELAGVAGTERPGSIHQGHWYEVTVEVLEEKINAYLNGEQQWSIERADLSLPDFRSDFLYGIGIATWGSLCKFKDPLIADKSEATLIDHKRGLPNDDKIH